MTRYYVNNTAQANGDYDVHKEDCSLLAFILSKTDLGVHGSCYLAVDAAKQIYKQANPCQRCAKGCSSPS
ncbi:hypothetical protein [uncultured Zobellia sp.]|uniref:hypothetical protein n=1 Tax=uncultured Zobellia sp. TaxID=255433 RepID=UPI0025919544|nr:hypothetical protein [uncultured Zobellia sp.]